MRENLLELFEYDLWANLQWAEILDTMPDPAKAKKIYKHALNAQRSWMTICLSEEDAGAEISDDFIAESHRMNKAWVDLIKICDPIAYASYSRGETFFMQTIGEIAHHVINHGTYHRGHLRGLCDAAEFTEFPDTDLIKFYRAKSAATQKPSAPAQ